MHNDEYSLKVNSILQLRHWNIPKHINPKYIQFATRLKAISQLNDSRMYN